VKVLKDLEKKRIQNPEGKKEIFNAPRVRTLKPKSLKEDWDRD